MTALAAAVGEGAHRTRSRPPRRSSISRIVVPLLVAISGLAAGCSISPQDIERWKGTEKGPARLREALKNGSLAVELRAAALTALVEIGSITEVEEDLKEIPEAQKRELVHAAVKPLVAMARGKGGVDPANTTRAERLGKDGLFLVRDGASPEDRTAIDAELVAWTTADLDARMTAGISAERILTQVGAAAGPRLVEVLGDPKASEANRNWAVRILAKVADREQREAGGAKLVERARREAQEGKGQGQGQGKVAESTFGQLGLIGGDHATAWLTSLASDAKAPLSMRSRALMAMSQAPDPASLDMALRIAGDAKADGELRDAAFELLGKLGAPAVPGLSRLLNDKNDKIRWEVVETMLFAGRLAAVPAVLEGLSPARTYSKEDLRDFVVRDIGKLGPAALPPLRDALKSGSWVARICAAMAIAELGKAADAPAVAALSGDGFKLKGWPGGATIGSEATALAATLRARH